MSGVYELCSPRGPLYSGKLIARAVELYRSGVKPGYIRWDELQATLEKDFASEFLKVGQDRPTPETVIAWVKKYPDLSQRLKDLRVQQDAPNQRAQRMPLYPPAYQPGLASTVPNTGIAGWDINVLFKQMMALVTMAFLFSCVQALSSDG